MHVSIHRIDGNEIAKKIRKEIKEEVRAFKNIHNITPTLGVVLTSDDPASQIYVQKKQEACEEVGIHSHLFQPFKEKNIENTTEAWNILSTTLQKINTDENIHGYLVQLPLLPCLKHRTLDIFDQIKPSKDVDVFHPENVGLLVQNRPRFLPCTPYGVQLLLKYSKIDPRGKHVVIINRSEIVGKPLSSMLIQDNEYANATVTVCHDNTPASALKEMTLQADIIVVAVGIPNFIQADMVKEGVVIIDVGITRVEKKLYGDVNFTTVAPKTSKITPVPGGVGPMTVTMLLKNTLKAAQLYVENTSP
jgi:methylenetetrahydrofolate dehydrogenase (NADP+)/methenyltetrahydrofolate cyclohydrolase